MNTSALSSTSLPAPFLPDTFREDVEDAGYPPTHETGRKATSERQIPFSSTGTAKDAALKQIMKEYTQNSLLLQGLEEYLAMRQASDKPLTEASLIRVLRKLDRISQGDERVKAVLLEQSVQRRWTGIFPLRAPVFADVFQTSAERRAEVDMATEQMAREILFNTRYEE